MGRLWQMAILKEWKEIFAWLPVETLIKEHQKEYYNALSASDKDAKSTVFIEFMLSLISNAIKEIIEAESKVTVNQQKIIDAIKANPFVTQEEHNRKYEKVAGKRADKTNRCGQKRLLAGGGMRMSKLKEYNGRFCESDFESAFICFLENECWKYILGNNISRTSKRDVLIADDFKAFISGENADLTENEVSQNFRHCSSCGK